jgi:hypothetical protein
LNKIFHIFWREFNLKFSQYSEVFVLRIGKHRKANYTYMTTVLLVAQSVGLHNYPVTISLGSTLPAIGTSIK